MLKRFLLIMAVAAGALGASAAEEERIVAQPTNWAIDRGAMEVEIPSTLDGKEQPLLYREALGEAPRPLLLSLHTWSADYTQHYTERLEYCIDQNWHFIQPDYRGGNMKPEAMGSELAVQDVIDALDYALKEGNVDQERIYLLGSSGGGYMALLMAGRHPDRFSAISAWCPISDLEQWHRFSTTKGQRKYARHIEKALETSPDDPEFARSCAVRSPLTYLNDAREVKIDISVGIHDGHTGSVPVGHSMRAFNAVADIPDRIAEEDISFIEESETLPPALAGQYTDPDYGQKRLLLRRTSNNARLNIFDGGHEEIPLAAFRWLDAQRKSGPAHWKRGNGNGGYSHLEAKSVGG